MGHLPTAGSRRGRFLAGHAQRDDKGQPGGPALRPVLAGELFGLLRDLDLFARVAVDAEAQSLVWPNGADFDPATLHDWPEHEQALRELARRWEPVEA